MPADLRVRSWIPTRTMHFLREQVGTQTAQQLVETLSPQARSAAIAATAVDWCSAAVYSELNEAVAKTAGGDDAKARELMIACGEYVAGEATNTFMKLVLQMLIPGVFAKKLPDFFRRDFSQGRLEVEATSERLVCRLHDIQGLHHLPCTGAGFVKFALSRMGRQTKELSIHNWSLSAPCAADAWFELTWRSS